MGENVFNNAVKIARAKVIGPWRWWRTYGGAGHSDFVHDIARVVLNLRCNSSATERVNSMYKNVIGLRRCRMNNDRAEKLVYTYVNSRAMKKAREAQREQGNAEAKEINIFELPKLNFDSENQDPNVYGSLGHEPLTSIGVDAFVADDHVHELHDIIEGLTAREHHVEEGSSARAPSHHHLSGIDEEADFAVSDEGENHDDNTLSDDDMNLTPKTQREIDEMLERQDKRARGLGVDDKDCKTPPYPRVARRARVIPCTTPLASHTLPNDPMHLVSTLPMHDYVARASHQPINTSTHQPINPSAPSTHPYQHPIQGFNNQFMLNPYHVGMSVNLHLGNAMHPPPP